VFFDRGDEFVPPGVQLFSGQPLRRDTLQGSDFHHGRPLQVHRPGVEAHLVGDGGESGVEVGVHVAPDDADPGAGNDKIGRGRHHALRGQQPAHHPAVFLRHRDLLIQGHLLPGRDADPDEEAARHRVVRETRGHPGGRQ
jgi:hypothetical protein